MKKIIALIFLTLSTVSFAQTSTSHSTSIADLSKVFTKSHHTLSLKTHDTLVGYAGEDMVKKITLPLELTA